jgi:hypothetical protein
MNPELELPGQAENDAENPAEVAAEKKLQARAEMLLDEIKKREAVFEKGWWKTGSQVLEIYSIEPKNKPEENTPYNILYSNTEVLAPSLYSATPKPDVRGRFKGAQLKPIPDVLTRFLTCFVDSGEAGSETFDVAMNDAVLSALVPGMGYIRLRYYQDRANPLVCESGHFKNLIWGAAPKWAKVPWIAFKSVMPKERMKETFKIGDEAFLQDYVPDPNSKDDPEAADQCIVYEAWDKETRQVFFLSEQWGKKVLRISEDPMKLTNFFPTPGPLILTQKPGKLSPVPLYEYYRNQAEELNRVSVRLNKVLSAIRVRGAYNGLLGDDLKKLLSSDELENELIPAQEAALLAQSGGFDKHIWMLPIEKLITVAQELYKAREAIKQVIYELTGISDIIRGSSVASETATAQDLKNKWGTVRLRRMQTTVANYTRDLFRMAVDCGTSVIPEDVWARLIQMPQIPTSQAKEQAKLLLQQKQSQPPIPQPPPMPGQPSQPPAPDPQLQQLQQFPRI